MHEYLQTYEKWKKRRNRRRLLLFLSFAFSLIALFALMYPSTFLHIPLDGLKNDLSHSAKQTSQNIILLDRDFETRLSRYKSGSKPMKRETSKATSEPNETAPQRNISSQKLKLSSSTIDEKRLIQKFTHTPSPYTALTLARFYFQKGVYEDAKIWALKANDLNPELEEPWLLYAKALIKLKQKRKAIMALEKYIAQSGSKKATILLQDIQRGVYR